MKVIANPFPFEQGRVQENEEREVRKGGEGLVSNDHRQR